MIRWPGPRSCVVISWKINAQSVSVIEIRLYDFKQHLDNKCSICNKSFACVYYLRVHEKNHKKHEGVHKCDICQRRFQTYSGLMIHCKSHLRKTVQCTHCSLFFSNKSTFKMHWNVRHLPHVKDGKCGETFSKITGEASEPDDSIGLSLVDNDKQDIVQEQG